MIFINLYLIIKIIRIKIGILFLIRIKMLSSLLLTRSRQWILKLLISNLLEWI